MPPPEQQRAGDGCFYTRRLSTDTNMGRAAHGDCPCLVLMVLYHDATIVGTCVQHLLCPSCAAGWVREEACEECAAS